MLISSIQIFSRYLKQKIIVKDVQIRFISCIVMSREFIFGRRMKHLKKLIATSTIALTATGCVTTGNNSPSNSSYSENNGVCDYSSGEAAAGGLNLPNTGTGGGWGYSFTSCVVITAHKKDTTKLKLLKNAIAELQTADKNELEERAKKLAGTYNELFGHLDKSGKSTPMKDMFTEMLSNLN